MIPNPPWVNRVLSKHWDAIEDVFGDSAPIQMAASLMTKRRTFTELGCGHYGCVFPTAQPGTVFKITSDPTEAAFVVAATSVGEWPDGMVRYHQIRQIVGESHKGRPVYVLTREEAENVGEFSSKIVVSAAYVELVRQRLTRFKLWAAAARNRITKSTTPAKTIQTVSDRMEWAESVVGWDAATKGYVEVPFQGARGAAYAARAAQIVAQEMGQEDVGYLIGQALDFYIEHGLLLADVHLGNIGQVHREDYTKPPWVITDPGHMVPIDPRWIDLSVPEL